MQRSPERWTPVRRRPRGARVLPAGAWLRRGRDGDEGRSQCGGGAGGGVGWAGVGALWAGEGLGTPGTQTGCTCCSRALRIRKAIEMETFAELGRPLCSRLRLLQVSVPGWLDFGIEAPTQKKKVFSSSFLIITFLSSISRLRTSDFEGHHLRIRSSPNLGT